MLMQCMVLQLCDRLKSHDYASRQGDSEEFQQYRCYTAINKQLSTGTGMFSYTRNHKNIARNAMRIDHWLQSENAALCCV